MVEVTPEKECYECSLVRTTTYTYANFKEEKSSFTECDMTLQQLHITYNYISIGDVTKIVQETTCKLIVK
jgi:hypothetical protein